MKKLFFGALAIAAVALFPACENGIELSIDLNKDIVETFTIPANADTTVSGSEVIDLTTNKELADNIDKLESVSIESLIMSTKILSGGDGTDCSLWYAGNIMIEGVAFPFGFQDAVSLDGLVAAEKDLTLEGQVGAKILEALKAEQTVSLDYQLGGTNSGEEYEVEVTVTMIGKAVAKTN